MPTDANTRLRPNGRGWMWPVAVVGIFCVSLSVCAFTIYAATSDASHAVEDDYYARAVAWDDTARQRVRNAELGWRTAADLGEADAEGARTLTLTLLDANSVAIEDVHVEAMVFHHARRGDAALRTLEHAGAGVYRAVLPEAREGVWQVRLRAERQGERFTATLDLTTPGMDTDAAGPKAAITSRGRP